MKVAIAAGYALLIVGILIRLFVPGLGIVGMVFAALGGVTVAVSTVSAASRRNR